jgi:hypothetical protein
MHVGCQTEVLGGYHRSRKVPVPGYLYKYRVNYTQFTRDSLLERARLARYTQRSEGEQVEVARNAKASRGNV